MKNNIEDQASWPIRPEDHSEPKAAAKQEEPPASPAIQLLSLIEYERIVAAGPAEMARSLRRFVRLPEPSAIPKVTMVQDDRAYDLPPVLLPDEAPLRSPSNEESDPLEAEGQPSDTAAVFDAPREEQQEEPMAADQEVPEVEAEPEALSFLTVKESAVPELKGEPGIFGESLIMDSPPQVMEKASETPFFPETTALFDTEMLAKPTILESSAAMYEGSEAPSEAMPSEDVEEAPANEHEMPTVEADAPNQQDDESMAEEAAPEQRDRAAEPGKPKRRTLRELVNKFLF